MKKVDAVTLDRRTFLDCLDDYCSGSLDANHKQAVEEFLRAHPEERDTVRRHQALLGVLGRWEHPKTPEELRRRVMESLRAQPLEADAPAIPTPIFAPPEALPPAARARRPIVLWPRYLLRAAAVLVITLVGWQLYHLSRQEAERPASARIPSSAPTLATAVEAYLVDEKASAAYRMAPEKESGSIEDYSPTAGTISAGDVWRVSDSLAPQQPEEISRGDARYYSYGHYERFDTASAPRPEAPALTAASSPEVLGDQIKSKRGAEVLWDYPSGISRDKAPAAADPPPSAAPSALSAGRPIADFDFYDGSVEQAQTTQEQSAEPLRGRETQLGMARVESAPSSSFPTLEGQQIEPVFRAEAAQPLPEEKMARANAFGAVSPKPTPLPSAVPQVPRQRFPDSAPSPRPEIVSGIKSRAVAEPEGVLALNESAIPSAPLPALSVETEPDVLKGKDVSPAKRAPSSAPDGSLSSLNFAAAQAIPRADPVDLAQLPPIVHALGGEVLETRQLGDHPFLRIRLEGAENIQKLEQQLSAQGWRTANAKLVFDLGKPSRAHTTQQVYFLPESPQLLDDSSIATTPTQAIAGGIIPEKQYTLRTARTISTPPSAPASTSSSAFGHMSSPARLVILEIEH